MTTNKLVEILQGNVKAKIETVRILKSFLDSAIMLFNQWQSAYQNFYNDFTSWFNNLTSTLGIATYNQKYEVNATSTEGQGSFKPNIEEYNSTDGDILEVYINGFRLIKGTDYTISGNGSNLNISFKNNLNADNTISVTVVKSELGVYPTNAT